MTPGTLWSIDAPHFCCGLVVHEGRVVEAAPILHWTIGRRWSEVRAYMVRKDWRGEPCGLTTKLYPSTRT